MRITDENISGKVLDHLGLVAVTIEKLGLIEKIDKRLPLKNSKITMGQRVAAMQHVPKITLYVTLQTCRDLFVINCVTIRT